MTKKREPIFVKQNLTATTRAVRNIEVEAKKRELELLKRKERIYHCLPHLYGYKWYRWARAFFESTHKVQLLTSGNQLSKSSTMIRKCIDWATDKSKWEKLWPANPEPRLFWYFYPTLTVATTEVETKWIPEFLPREEFRDDPVYGWKLTYDKQGNVQELRFNSGVTVQFKAYSMQAINLQTSTVWVEFIDEEMPVVLYDELMFRLHATNGYFISVFTATLGQEFWRCAMEEVGSELETLKDAYKVQVSAYDCMYYEDGTASPWTLERIKAAERKCKSDAEVRKRILGKFVMDEGLKIETFSPSRHFVQPFPIPDTYQIYVGADIGSGGATNHPAAISFIAVDPLMRKGFVFRGWRGDGVVTTAADVLEKYKELSADLNVTNRLADPRAVDFHNIAQRAGVPFVKAESKHDIGDAMIATLFKNDMLFIFETPELRKLGVEISSLTFERNKKYAKDDFYDTVRYQVPAIPWDWSVVYDKLPEELKKDVVAARAETDEEREKRERRGRFLPSDGVDQDDWSSIEAEMEFWNEQYE